MPQKLLQPFGVVGTGMFLMASTLVSRGVMISPCSFTVNRVPKYTSYLTNSWLFFGDNFKPFLIIVSKRFTRRDICASLVLCNNRSSMIAMILSRSGMPARRKLTYVIQMAGLVPSPMGKTSYL